MKTERYLNLEIMYDIINILITDDKENRRKHMVDLFKPLSQVYILNFNSGYIESDCIEPGVWEVVNNNLLPKFHLHLIHGGNLVRKDEVKSIHRIWYGGYGADDTRSWGNEPIINFPIHENSYLKINDAEEIIRYIKKECQCPNCLSIKKEMPPLILQRIDYLELLSSPSKYDWQSEPPKGLFFKVESDWKEFKTKVKKIIDQNPNLTPTNKAYKEYSKLLSELYKSTIEDQL